MTKRSCVKSMIILCQNCTHLYDIFNIQNTKKLNRKRKRKKRNEIIKTLELEILHARVLTMEMPHTSNRGLNAKTSTHQIMRISS